MFTTSPAPALSDNQPASPAPVKEGRKLCARKASKLVLVWSNQGTESEGKVTLFNPFIEENSEGAFLGFIARSWWLVGSQPGQRLPIDRPEESPLAAGCSGMVYSFDCEPGTRKEQPITSTSLPTSALSPSDISQSPQLPPVVSSSSLPVTPLPSDASEVPLLVRPSGYRILWKDEGLTAQSPCSIWRPLPPSDDYAAVGFLVVAGHKRPDPMHTNLRCVHKSLLVQGCIIRRPVWINRHSKSRYKVSIWPVSPGPSQDQQEEESNKGGATGRWDWRGQFFLAAAGHEPPPGPVYILRPDAVWYQS